METMSYYLVSLGIIAVALIVFGLHFERRKPRAREIVVLAVMVALAVAGRAAFFMVPQFKPVAAIVIITGVALGAESGFLVGVLAAFVSNFLFGQGPWTPFQMIAFGTIGFVAGLLFNRARRGNGLPSSDVSGVKERSLSSLIPLCLYGGASVVLIYGLIVDVSAILLFSESVTPQTLLLTLGAGIPFNLLHAVATVFFLLVLANPMLSKLDRIKTKFGLL
jgi:uncharacterized membrane protein